MRARSILGMVCIIALTSSARAQAARETLQVLAQCHDVTDLACFVGGLEVDRARAQSMTRREVGTTEVTKILLVEGSLPGGETRPYALRIKQARADYFADTDRSGPVALRGEINGSPLVLTTRGQLLVLSEGVRVEPVPNVIVLNETNGKPLARYYDACVDLSFLNPRTTTIWDGVGRRCIDVKTGSASPRFCARPSGESCVGVPSHFRPATDMTVERLEELARDLSILRLEPSAPATGFFGGSGWALWAYRVPDTPFLVFYGYCGDCDEVEYELQ